MKAVFALCAALLGTTSAAHAAPPHYDVAAHFDPDGLLAADVTLTLSEGDREKAFLLSDRFALQPMALPDGETMTVEPSAPPMPAPNNNVFRFAAPDPVQLRFRLCGPNTSYNASGTRPIPPSGQ